MELIDWSYGRRYQIKAVFSSHPNSPVIFRSFPDYYFIYTVKWSDRDSPVSRDELAEMEKLLNEELGCLKAYETRRSICGRAGL
ncbi:hypothetical protein K8O68_20840 [Salipaludibacillus sp. CUR1]|uniref:hypothetical protein n=1 Tax=Salipaludibacillus sp. CUR1 TaxID=2820003 RepID=UPI001E599713|nr:hypothetical protein [Salipaludibacillus sp. CUR1]MCE7794838.1 hypothetical protein [Salipaludibacillus sp. CUR1]